MMVTVHGMRCPWQRDEPHLCWMYQWGDGLVFCFCTSGLGQNNLTITRYYGQRVPPIGVEDYQSFLLIWGLLPSARRYSQHWWKL